MSSVRKEHIKTLKGPDQFQVKVMTGVDWAVKNVRTILIAVLPVALVVAGLAGYRLVQSKRKDARIEELGKSQVIYDTEARRASDLQKPILKKMQEIEAKAAPKAAGQDGSNLTPQQEQEVTALRKQAEAIKPDHAASTAAFLAFYQKYENHAEGWLAGMMAAHSMIGDNKLANASTLLEGIASKSKADATYQALANLELAGIAEEQGEYDRELSILTNLEISTNSDLKPKLQLMRGRALFLKGDKAGAKTTLNTLIEGYSSSTEAQKARSLLTLIN